MAQFDIRAVLCAAGCLAGGLAGTAQAGFGGQIILGPLSNGDVVFGSTLGAGDENDGFTSGDHIFNIWDGGDDVYAMEWLGGDMTVTLESLGGSDNDLFIYSPGSYDDSGDYSAAGAFDAVSLLNAEAGLYYIVVDSTFFSEGDYRLAVVPAPSAAGLAVVGMGLLGGRRRR